jgi:hypothetical protein
VLVPTTCNREDTSRVDLDNNSTSMAFQEQSDLNNGRTTHWKSNQTEEVQISDLLQTSTQDGGNSSDYKDHSLSTIDKRLWKFLEVLIMKTKTFRSTTSTEESISNGLSSMLTNTQTSQSKENSTLTSVCILRETSTLSPSYLLTDTLISSTTETW